MKKTTVVLVSVVLGLGAGCGSRANKAARDGAVDVGLQGGGGTGGVAMPGTGGATGGGTGGGTHSGTGGIGTGGAGTGRGGSSGAGGGGAGGSSGAGGGGAGGTGPKLDGGTSIADSGADGNAAADGAIPSCEKAGDTCVATINGCAVCPGGHPRTTRMGCASNSWCCTRTAPSSNPCTQAGGICGSTGSCPDGWTAMRTECETGSGLTCCAAVSLVCTNARTPVDAGSAPDAVDAPPPDPLGLACTKAVSCLGAEQAADQGISNCVARATQLLGMDQSLLTYPMLLNDDRDWLYHFGLAQNVDCIAAAASCQGVRDCLAPPQNPTICASGSPSYLYGRRCSDATHLVGCSLDTDVRIDCAKLGTKCVESPPTASGDIGLAACALQSPGGPATPQVTCQGNLATVKLREAEYTYDCGINADCVPGSHAFSVDDQVCKGKAPGTLTCTSSEVTRRCDGENLVLSCPDGSEQVNECLRNGRRCFLYTNGQLMCAPPCSTSVEQCINGVITYCDGPGGTAKIDCAALGFSGCDADTSVYRAWCVL
jgi:hypothetical protein